MINQDIFVTVRNSAITAGLIGVLFSFVTSSCTSVKPATTKSAAKLYETFFVGEEGTQYFIKPLKFDNNQKEDLVLDLTFRSKNIEKDSAIINFSIFKTDLYKAADSLIIENALSSIAVKELAYMFAERDKKLSKSRFSTKIKLTDVKQLFESNGWVVKLYSAGNLTEFEAPKSTMKKIDKLNYEIFSLY